MTDQTLLCFGDSNTHGSCAIRQAGDLVRFDRNIRWPGVMAADLGTGFHVIEEGHPGRTTLHNDPIEGPHKNGIAMLPALLETHRPLDLVIVMLGTNDLKQRYGLPACDIAASVDRLLRMIVSSNSGLVGQPPKALLVAPTPILETGFLANIFAGGAAKSAEFSERFAYVAQVHNVPFVDAGALIEVDPVDGIHLDAAAHHTFGRAMANAVRAALAA
jgi:lysophospholipase L1-like esterase